MGDSQQSKDKNPYLKWSTEETKVLIELLVEGIQRGWRDSNGIMNKATVVNKILPVLNERLGCIKNYTHYQSRIKYLKTQYQSYVDLQNNSSGFGWDPETKKFTASDEVWQGYFKAHPNHKYMRYDSHDQFEDLKIIFDCATANGSNSIGLGDTTDARTYRVGDIQVRENLNFYESGDDDDASLYLDKNLKIHAEKLIPRKRSRTEACNNLEGLKSDNNDSMITVSNKILSIIQQREERQQKEAERREEKLKLEAEQREAEKKKNNVWDAMKEIPSVDQRTKFKATTLSSQNTVTATTNTPPIPLTVIVTVKVSSPLRKETRVLHQLEMVSTSL